MVKITRTSNIKKVPEYIEDLGFGKIFTDHMFVMDYSKEEGWNNPEIVPYAPISLDPSSVCFHYGQNIFEGMKAYRHEDEKIYLFRPRDHITRFNASCVRMCIPMVDEEDMLKYIENLIVVDNKWVPSFEGSSLYIRPFIIATTATLGVKPAVNYKMVIIMSPVGSYYEDGIKPINIHVETELVRATQGGVGNVKTAGNYAASLLAQQRAGRKGFDQVLWLDSFYHKYIEEVGVMNIFFSFNKKIVTPKLNGTILPGVTRQTVIDLCNLWEVDIEERRISIEEVTRACYQNKLEEIFGTGTAAIISPIGHFSYDNKKYEVNKGEIGQVSQALFDVINQIQYGEMEDQFNWLHRVKI
ncbi:MAG: branched-chain amino acid aminotransferase [Oscillospiraceae bacterium]|nr:branched-chain amino acid aminotransferase [Oscillospiraceae bacterium]